MLLANLSGLASLVNSVSLKKSVIRFIAGGSESCFDGHLNAPPFRFGRVRPFLRPATPPVPWQLPKKMILSSVFAAIVECSSTAMTERLR